jgi:hypothetical protein
VITLDGIEEMDAERLDLIPPDTRQQRIAGLGHIGLYKGPGKLAAGEPRDRHGFEQNGVSARDATGGMKFMGAAGQSFERYHERLAVRRLGQEPAFEAKRLIGTDNEPIRHFPADTQSFGTSKMEGYFPGACARREKWSFHITFLDSSVGHLKGNPGRGKKTSPRGTFRRKNEGGGATPKLRHEVAMNFSW